jgi:hypothetical protein
MVKKFKNNLRLLDLVEGTDIFSRNVGRELPLYAALIMQKKADLIYIAAEPEVTHDIRL